MKNGLVKYLASDMQTHLQKALGELSEARNLMPRHPDDPKHPGWNVTIAYEELKALEKIVGFLL